MLSSVARWAGYGAFMIEGLVGAALRGFLVIIALVITYVLGAWVYEEAPWYDRAVIHALGSAPRPAPWGGDATEKAARFFPTGMAREAARALLGRNGFSCSGAASPNQLNCSRTTQQLPCRADYSVELTFDEDQRIADRNASYYYACL
ncbi:MAG TPA: hypothetical protein VIY51_21325 [Xanthobacteraceae bacterium]